MIVSRKNGVGKFYFRYKKLVYTWKGSPASAKLTVQEGGEITAACSLNRWERQGLLANSRDCF